MDFVSSFEEIVQTGRLLFQHMCSQKHTETVSCCLKCYFEVERASVVLDCCLKPIEYNHLWLDSRCSPSKSQTVSIYFVVVIIV